MGSVLLHVAHQRGSVDVAVPDDEPVARLLPSLLAAAGVRPDGSEWHLAGLDGAVVPAASTLRGAAIPSGSTVRLVTGANGAPPPPPPPPPAHAPPPHATPAQAPPPAALPVGT
ncbi:MAG: EsaB/YukD family protein, partial [Candidatus Dormibacteraeota bacterium]|nr:EsaB/YukD family protein [Candidatus Dormibacteraeota bacterium]